MNLSRLLSRLRDRWPDILRSISQDLGTMSLRAATIILARAFHTPPNTQFSTEMLIISIACVAVGVLLRAFAKL